MNGKASSASSLVFFLFLQAAYSQERFPATNDPIPEGWGEEIFDPNYNFPTVKPGLDATPWTGIDFRTEPERYLQAVLDYIFEGMDTNSWDGASNTVRQWYHAPWMHEGKNGREFIHGLTRERSSRKGELGTGQTKCYQNWAVSLTNPMGGYTYGRVWGDSSRPPDPRNASFDIGTVFAKLLFTQAPAEEVPLLAGAPTWKANVHNPEVVGDNCPGNEMRLPQVLRLLQFDVAVRHDVSEAPTGWVYGTFIYDGRTANANPWKNLKPAGLMWGNDPDLSDAEAADGVMPTESLVLSDFGLGRSFGRGGRMNGPVDNPDSACLSCHMTAQYVSIAEMVPYRTDPQTTVDCWFRNLAVDEPFGREPRSGFDCGDQPARATVSTGTSLQLALGLRAYAIAKEVELPTMPGEISIPADPVSQNNALIKWLSQPPAIRATAIDNPISDHGLLSQPITRGD